LLTAKEELQSTNEELTTVNEEMNKPLEQTGLFPTVADVERLRTDASRNATWRGSVSLVSKQKQPYETEAIGNSYQEGGKTLVEVSLRRQGGDVYLEGARRDSHDLDVALRLAAPVATLFNNVLTSILGHADRLEQSQDASPQLLAGIRAIRDAGEKGAEMTRQLLAFAHLYPEGTDIVDLGRLVQGLEQVVQVLLAGVMTFELRIAPEAVLVEGEAIRIEAIVIGMIASSRDAVCSGGHLIIETRNQTIEKNVSREHPAVPAGHYAVISVTNRSTGNTPASAAPLLLTAASALDSLQKQVGEQGGHMWSYSETGKGSHVSIYLPRAVPAVHKAYAGRRGGAESILVVDPEAQVLDLAARVLADRGYAVHFFRNANEALQWANLQSNAVDVVVTELTMAPMDGIEFVKQLQSVFPGMQALFITGGVEGTTANELSDLNEARVLRKPFSPSDLEEAVRRLIDGIEAANEFAPAGNR
jgi:CheY-like chemotaxis protein